MITRIGLALAVLVPSLVATGCTWDEGLEINNMTGKIVVPRDAATREFQDEEGNITAITDVRLIGPVYLGLYPGLAPAGQIERYPHPFVGPQFTPGTPGDTYPYGGTSIGAFRNACLDFMKCKVISGRYVDFDAMLEWYADVLGTPITDLNGDPITNGEFLRQTCFSTFEFTSDEEIRLTVTEDRNDDGQLDELDLDFVENADGDFEADFIIWQQEYFQDEETGQGMSLWAYMDGPASDGLFNSCTSAFGSQVNEYNQEYQSGAVQRDLLNRPANYVSRGDWVSGLQDDGNVGYIYQDPNDTPTLRLNFEVQ